MNMDTITLDTRLADIGWDNAHLIAGTLIDERLAGDDWGWAWDRCVRSSEDATVRDLRDALYAEYREGRALYDDPTTPDLGYEIGPLYPELD